MKTDPRRYTAQSRTEIESNSSSGSDNKWLKNKAPRIGYDVFLQLLVLYVLILRKSSEKQVLKNAKN
jgi:hypothetical protein